jgi:hypothetical protein
LFISSFVSVNRIDCRFRGVWMLLFHPPMCWFTPSRLRLSVELCRYSMPT